MITKDLGAVSAYAYAVEKGYTGTEAEYAELMASYATVAEQASQSAQTATEKAQQVSASATSASQSADTASASATSASQSATTATAKASEAQQSATTATTKAQEASQSASTASQSASTAVQAKQDAESAKTASQTAQGLAESARDDAEQIKTDVQNIADGIVTRLVDVEDALAEKAPVITDTASGSIASFSDGADNLPLKSLIVDIDPIQDLSNGDPSPENICPISGWTEVGVNQSGVNVCDEEWELGVINRNTGVNYSSNSHIRSKNYIPVLPNTSYYNKGYTLAILEYDADKNYLGDNIGYHNYGQGVFTTSTDAHYIRFYRTTTTYNHDVSINYPSTDHEYHPYSGQSITIALGQTVYGGKLDVLSGVLTVDRAEIASYNGEALPSTWISDRNVYAEGTTPTTGAQVVYELATPITIQLTPNQVNSLLGVNNLWADTGDSTVTYRADATLYINRKIAEAVSALS